MCFTPIISLVTALIEFGISAYIYVKIKDKKLYPLLFFVLFLGIYQFSEFMLCTSSSEKWARIGFVAYTFVPIFVYHLFINLSKKKIMWEFYSIPIIFALIALLLPNFISYTNCNYMHVTVESVVFNQNILLMILYLLYYISLPFYGIYIFTKKIRFNKNNVKMKVVLASIPVAIIGAMIYYFISVMNNNVYNSWIYTSLIILLSVLIVIILSFMINKSDKYFMWINSIILITSILILLLSYFLIPNISKNYSSIFCQFALLYAVASIVLVKIIDGKT